MGDPPDTHQIDAIFAPGLSPGSTNQWAIRAGRIHGAEPPAGPRNIAPRYNQPPEIHFRAVVRSWTHLMSLLLGWDQPKGYTNE